MAAAPLAQQPYKSTGNFDAETGELLGMQLTAVIDDFGWRNDFNYSSLPVPDETFGLEIGKGYWDFTVTYDDAAGVNGGMFRVQIRYHDGNSQEDFIADVAARFESPYASEFGVDFPVVQAASIRSNGDGIICSVVGNALDSQIVNDGSVLVRVFIDFPKASWYTKSFRKLSEIAFLRRNTAELYQSKRLSDFILISSDHIEHPVHRCILDSGSPVFRAMFETNMTERTSGKVNITEIDGATLDGLLKYLYGVDVTSSLDELAESLLIAADKYQVSHLKTTCSNHLRRSVDSSNAARLLILADEMALPYLTASVLEYIGENFSSFKSAGGMEQLRDHEKGKLLFVVMEYLGCRVEKSRKRTAAEAGMDN